MWGKPAVTCSDRVVEAALARSNDGAASGNRTPDLRITREWLRCWLLMAESVSLAAALAGPVSDWLGAARRGHAGDTEPEGNHHET